MEDICKSFLSHSMHSRGELYSKNAFKNMDMTGMSFHPDPACTYREFVAEISGSDCDHEFPLSSRISEACYSKSCICVSSSLVRILCTN